MPFIQPPLSAHSEHASASHLYIVWPPCMPHCAACLCATPACISATALRYPAFYSHGLCLSHASARPMHPLPACPMLSVLTHLHVYALTRYCMRCPCMPLCTLSHSLCACPTMYACYRAPTYASVLLCFRVCLGARLCCFHAWHKATSQA